MPNDDDLKRFADEQEESMTSDDKQKRDRLIAELAEVNRCITGSQPAQTMQLEVNEDPFNARVIVQEIVKGLRGENGRGASREISLAITKLQEAAYWLGEAMFGSGSNGQ